METPSGPGFWKPPAASLVGVNPEIIEDGRSEEWREVLQLLVSSPTRLEEMGQTGWRRVVEHYAIPHWLPVFLDLLDKARGGGHG